jgi:hypothetical protein
MSRALNKASQAAPGVAIGRQLPPSSRFISVEARVCS